MTELQSARNMSAFERFISKFMDLMKHHVRVSLSGAKKLHRLATLSIPPVQFPKDETNPIESKRILDLPPEIIRIVIYFIFCSKYSIIPFITCCRDFYERYAYLIYMTKVVNLNLREDSKWFTSYDSEKTKHTLKYLAKHKNDVSIYIPVLKISSNTNSNLVSKDYKPSLNIPLLFDILPSMKNLTVLTIDTDEPDVIFQALCHLPPNIEVFRLQLKLTKHQFNKKAPYLIPVDYDKIASLSKLGYFELESKKYKIVSERHTHPELAPNLFNWGVDLGEHTSSFSHFFPNKFITTYDKTITSNLTVKNRIGEYLYYFLLKNQSNLIKMEVLGFDMNLIFNPEVSRSPFQFDMLRLLFVDNSSGARLDKWLLLFKSMNQSPTFNNSSPIFVFYDVLGHRLYFHRVSDIDAINFGSWKSSDRVYTSYAVVNRKLDIRY